MKKTLLILGIFLVFVFYTPASSEEDVSLAEFKKAADMQGLKILALSSLMFKPFTSVEYQNFEWSFNEIGITVPNGNPASLTLLAQFHLPDGAEMKRVVAMYYDNSAAAGIDIGIGFVEPYDITEPTPSVFFTSDGLPEVDDLRIFQTSSISDPIIDNRNVYFALVEFDKETMGDVAFRALWIAYK
jgi:hypothetical protein